MAPAASANSSSGCSMAVTGSSRSSKRARKLVSASSATSWSTTSTARRATCAKVRVSGSVDMPRAYPLRNLCDRRLELVDADRALEALDHLAGAVDDEDPGLGLEPVGAQLRPQPLVGVVVDVDLVVDEGDVA